MSSKTNAARLLDRAGIAYEVREYEVDPSDLSAPSVALKVGMQPSQVFKTLLTRGPKGACFAIVGADAELDLKALARARDDRKMSLVPLKEVQPMTGYIRGGVTVLGAKKPFPAVVDESVFEHDVIAVSAGMRGAQLVLDPADYVRVTGAQTAAIQRR